MTEKNVDWGTFYVLLFSSIVKDLIKQTENTLSRPRQSTDKEKGPK